VTRSWLRSIRGVESLLFDTRVREIKNEVPIHESENKVPIHEGEGHEGEGD